MKSCRLKIFCDCDTIYTEESYYIKPLEQFILDSQKLSGLKNELNSGMIGRKNFAESVQDLVSDFDLSKYESVLGELALDESFVPFVNYCIENSHSVYLLDSGFGNCEVDLISNAGLNLPRFAMSMEAESSDSLRFKSEFTDEYCDDCFVCNRNILIANTNDLDAEISVYVGNSANGFCVSSFADLVFARGTLASYCWKRNITYYEFRDYSDILRKLKNLYDKNNLKQRQEAKFRRREILEGG